MRLKNKIALITGGSSGIGEETAKLFANEGATVIIADIATENGEKLAKQINGKFYYLDVSDENGWQKITEDIYNNFGKLDICFNNAGITGLEGNFGPQDPENISLESWHHIHKINLDGVFLGCKYAISLMKNNGGSIINMSSKSGIVGIPSASAYASSKAAIRNHTKTVALYCAEKGYKIRCNSLHPGAILTPMWDSMFGQNLDIKNAIISEISKNIPLGHIGEAKDVAYTAVYLASDESKYITGSEFVIDGGILAGSHAAPKQHDE